MRRVFLLPVLTLLVGLLLGLPAPSSAQSPDFATTIDTDFPQFLRFHLTGDAPGTVTDVSLRYRIIGSGSLARAKPEQFETVPAGSALRVEVRVATGTLGYIPVGSEFDYHWEILLEDGAVIETESAGFVYLPPGEDWKSVHNDFMRVYFHGDRESIALRYLEAAERTYARMGRLLQTELEVVPVKTVLFASEADLEAAQPNRSEVWDAATFLCGSQVANNIIFVIDRSCGTRDRSDTLRHEFTHILVEAAGESALGKIPSWLNEGTAVYSQTEPGRGFTDPFEVALAIDRLIPFSTMFSSAGDPSDVGLFYGQSYAMVRFLIDEGGEEAFARLFATIKAGNRFDRAIETVYGWTLSEFENEFRAYHELPTREPATPEPAREQPTPTPEATPEPERPQATPAPTEAPEQAEPEPTAAQPAAAASTSDDGGRDLSNIALGAIAGGAILALLAVFAFLLSVMLGNRGPQPEAAAAETPEATTPSGPTASSSQGTTFAASSRREEPEPDPEPEPEEPEYDEWGPPPT